MRAERFHQRSAYPVLLAFGALDAAGILPSMGAALFEFIAESW